MMVELRCGDRDDDVWNAGSEKDALGRDSTLRPFGDSSLRRISLSSSFCSLRGPDSRRRFPLLDNSSMKRFP